MRDNGSLSGREIELRDEQVIVSRADLAGRIVYVNTDFLAVSGFSEDEVLGQPHNIIRHPAMPAEVFADLWRDIQAGRPWIGILQNRTKQGDAYWVEAHVSPIWEKGVITGYQSMRRKPAAGTLKLAQESYAAIRENRLQGAVFRHGTVTETGWLARLRTSFRDATITFKFVFLSLLAALLVLGCFAYFLAQNVASVLDANGRERLRDDVHLVRIALESRIQAAGDEAEDHAQIISDRIYPALGGRTGSSRSTFEALLRPTSAGVPTISRKLFRDLNGVAAVFVRNGDNFESRLNNLQGESYSDFAVGNIDIDTPTKRQLLDGKPYVGAFKLNGRQFMAAYTPVFDNQSEVIGAIFFGLDLLDRLASLKSEIRGLKVASLGYYYIVDANPGPDFGQLILHPFKEGQHIRNTYSQNDVAIVEEMVSKGRGEIVYPWMNTEAGETTAHDKVVIFETLPAQSWIVAGGTTIRDFTGLSSHLAWLVIGGGLLMATAIFVIVLALLRSLVFSPLKREVLPAFQAMAAGGFESRLDVRGNDEIAQVIQGLECLQNRLAFNAEQERSLAGAREAALQAAERLSRTRTEFLANMSHEIRTPMNAIIGCSHLLLKGNLGKRELDYARRIDGAGKLLLALVNDILDFAKIDAGKMHLETSSFPLDDVLETVSSILRGRVQEKNLVLQYVVAPDIPPSLRGDAFRLSQILINLVGNAVKFTFEGSVTVFVGVGQRNAGQVRLDFRVQDTGIGMSPEQITKLFQAFAQADTSVTRRFGGTGLGLAITKHLIKLMGGSIELESQPNLGSVFSFNVWLGAEEDVQNTQALLPNYRLLVVDDNELARTILARLLQKYGCAAQTCDSGEAALAIMQSKDTPPFDGVLLDLNMPGMDGLTLARQIRHLYGQRTRLVLVTSANTHSEELCNALDDFDEVVEKPVTAARIAEILGAFDRDKSPGTMPENPAPIDYSLAGLQVLVAEDVQTNQLIIKDLLEAQGACVEIVDNGLLAVQRVSEPAARIDLVLMDIQMPVLDGLAATRRIRSGNVHQDVPIIAMTAHAFDEERQRAIAAGMNDFVTKPVEPDQLSATLQRWRPAAETAAATPHPTPPPPANISFPQLPGIDVEEALKRMRNRPAFYEKVLRDFYSRFTGETERIRSSLAAMERDEATRRAHSLKGLGATIGAIKLGAVAAALEEALKTDSPEIPSCLETFDCELNAVLTGIQQGLKIESSAAANAPYR